MFATLTQMSAPNKPADTATSTSSHVATIVPAHTTSASTKGSASTVSSSQAASLTTSAAAASSTAAKSSKDTPKIGLVVGLIVGLTLILAALLFWITTLLRKKNQNKEMSYSDDEQKRSQYLSYQSGAYTVGSSGETVASPTFSTFYPPEPAELPGLGEPAELPTSRTPQPRTPRDQELFI